MMTRILELPKAIWLILVGLSLFSVSLLVGEGLAAHSSAIIIGIAACKSHLVIQHYMEAKHASRTWRLLYGSWIFTVATVIIIGHYMTLISSPVL